MATPEQLEAAAARLRGLAKQAREASQKLATQVDPFVKTARDDTVWRGAYPDQALGQLQGFQKELTSSASLLDADAAAWDRKATKLEEQAAALRTEQDEEDGE